MRSLETKQSENDERDRGYGDVERRVRHDVLCRPMIHLHHDHLDRLRQQLSVPAAKNRKPLFHSVRNNIPHTDLESDVEGVGANPVAVLGF